MASKPFVFLGHTPFLRYTKRMNSLALRHTLSLLRDEDMSFSLLQDRDKIVVLLDGTLRSYWLANALTCYPLYAKKKLSFFYYYLEEDKPLPSSQLEMYQALGITVHSVPAAYIMTSLKTHEKDLSFSSSLRRHLEQLAAFSYLSDEIHGNKLLLLSTLDEAYFAFFKQLWNKDCPLLKPIEKIRGKQKIRPFLFCPESLFEQWKNENEVDASLFFPPLPLSPEDQKIDTFLQSMTNERPVLLKNFREKMKNGDLSLAGIHPCYESILDSSISYWPLLTAEDMRNTMFATRQRKEDEQDFLVLQNHHRIGAFAYRFTSKHRIEFFALEGSAKTQRLILQEWISRISKKTKPAHFVLLGVKKDIALSLGFQKETAWGQTSPHFEKKVD